MQARLVSDIMDVSRIAKGALVLDQAPVDIIAIIHSAIETLRDSASARQITIDVNVACRPVSIVGDARRLEQVFWNLLSNAVKFTSAGGRVEVALGRVAGDVVVNVEDDGVGIAPETLPHVFERFRQSDSSSSRPQAGLGLGLAIVQHLVELHGGTVTAASEGVGRGCRFTVRLPYQPIQERRHPDVLAQPRPVPPVASVEGTSPSLCGVRVFLIDDQLDAREVGAAVLRGAGAAVATAASAREALALLEVEVPDVLLVDIAMPDMDGYALLKEMRRAGGRASDTPAIAFTAYVREEDRRLALGAGFQGHLAKPVDAETLVRAVASAVKQDRTAPPA
jgi:CheY-like chemotaxis protein/two-component sensor histidine kinase